MRTSKSFAHARRLRRNVLILPAPSRLGFGVYGAEGTAETVRLGRYRGARTSYADCALSSSRWLNFANSAAKPAVSRPSKVAASISVVRRIDVATSALHSQQ